MSDCILFMKIWNKKYKVLTSWSLDPSKKKKKKACSINTFYVFWGNVMFFKKSFPNPENFSQDRRE